MTAVAVYLAIVIALAAVLCGHQGEDFPPFLWLRAARGRARGQTGVSRPQTVSSVSRVAVVPLNPADGRTEPQQRPAPHWAHTDTKDAA